MYTRTAISKDEFATTSPAIPRAGDGGAGPGSGCPFNWRGQRKESKTQEADWRPALLILILGPEDLPAVSLVVSCLVALPLGLEGPLAGALVALTLGLEGLAVPMVALTLGLQRRLALTPAWIVGTANRLPVHS